MNLLSMQAAVEILGWLFVALAIAKDRARPKCPLAPAAHWGRGLKWIVIVLCASTLSGIYAAVQGNALWAVFAFACYALAWLRFEARYDAKNMIAEKRARRHSARRVM